MNRTAKRFGKAPGAVVSANDGRDSSHGKAMVTPAPRRTARREMRLADFSIRLSILFTFPYLGVKASFIQELRACDNGLDHWSEAISIRTQFGLHALDRGFVGELERPAQSVCQ